jgi:hypothetical protein
MRPKRGKASRRTPDAAQQAILTEMAALEHQLANHLTQIGGRIQLLELTHDLPPDTLAEVRRVRDFALEAGRTLQRLAELTASLRRDNPTT